MKFGALLRNSAAELPELHQLFVSYKQLKKRLKRLPERQELVRQRVRVAGGELPEVDVREVRQQEEAFVQVLDQDVQQFNRYWLLLFFGLYGHSDVSPDCSFASSHTHCCTNYTCPDTLLLPAPMSVYLHIAACSWTRRKTMSFAWAVWRMTQQQLKQQSRCMRCTSGLSTSMASFC